MVETDGINSIDNPCVSKKKRKTAIVLCVLCFFGIGGLHRFYTGRIVSGIIHFCTFGYCFIGCILDLRELTNDRFTDSKGLPLIKDRSTDARVQPHFEGTAREGAARGGTACEGTAREGTAREGTAREGTACEGAARGGAVNASGTVNRGSGKFLAWSIINTVFLAPTVLPIVAIVLSVKGRKAATPEERKKRNKQATLLNLLVYAGLAAAIVVGLALNPPNSNTPSTYRGFRYGDDGNGGIIIREYTGNQRRVRIPDTIDGRSVQVIGTNAFSNRPRIISVTIPDTVVLIGISAFSRCTGLTEIIIPDSVVRINGSAFGNCTGLANIHIPESVTIIGDKAFVDTAWLNAQPDGLVYAGKVAYTYKGDRSSVGAIELLPGTRGIAENLFDGVESLTEISMPDSLMIICARAFRGCTGLVSVTIPDSVESIEDGVFSGCTGLTSVTLGRNVKSIGGYAFANCSALTSLDIPDSLTRIVDGVFNTDGTNSTWSGAFGGCNNLTRATYHGKTYSVEIRGRRNNGTDQYDLPEGFYRAVNIR